MQYREFADLYKKIDEKDRQLIRKLDYEGKLRHGVRESYDYIPNHGTKGLYEAFSHIKITLENAYRHDIGFIDVGAGTGRIVKLAKEFGFNPVCGVEFQEQYVKLGRKEYRLSDKELVVKDAFTLDAEFLKDFRAVYTYMPLIDRKRMSALCFHLNNIAKESTVFVEMLPEYFPLNRFARNHYQEFVIYMSGNY